MTTETTTTDDRRTIVVWADIAIPPERVLAAVCDFTDRRPTVFPAVSMRHMTTHSLGGTTADVTEGTRVGPFVFWERCTYDWSRPGIVTATVTDANVYAFPGSRWDLTATATEQGSHVEMVWTRIFQRNLRGRIMGFVYRHFGKRTFTKYGHEVAENLEKY